MERIVIENSLMEEWLRTAFMADDGQVFLPCGALGNELKAMLCIAFDGIPVIRHKGHIYAPTSWLAMEHPKYAKAINTIAASIPKKLQAKKTADSEMATHGIT